MGPRLHFTAAVVALVVASGCGHDEKKRPRVEDEEATSPPTASAAERRIEEALVELSRGYDREIEIKRAALRSIQCGTVTLSSSASLGDLFLALSRRGLQIVFNDRKATISRSIHDLGSCDREVRTRPYSILKGEIRDQGRDDDPDPDPTASSSASASAGPAPGARPDWLAEPEPPIQKGPLEWELPELTAEAARRGVRSFLFSPSTKARARLSVPAIAPGSLPEKLGLKEGDWLVSANGFSLSEPEARLGIYSKLIRASTVVLTIERAGKPLELKYVMR